MKITIEIPDGEIRQEVLEKVTDMIADTVFKERWSTDEMIYRRTLTKGVNDVLRNHTDEIIDKCIPHASAYIGKKGVKKLMDSLQKDVLDDD